MRHRFLQDRENGGKGLLEIGFRFGQLIADLEQRLQPLFLLLQLAGKRLDRLLQDFWFGSVYYHGSDLLHLAALIQDRKVMRRPVPGFDLAGQDAANLEVDDRLAGCQYAAEIGLNLRGEASKDFTHGPAQMAGRGHAVDSGQRVVNREIAQISVHDAKPHVGGAEEGGQQLLVLAEGIRSGVGENAVDEGFGMGAHNLASSTGIAAMIAD